MNMRLIALLFLLVMQQVGCASSGYSNEVRGDVKKIEIHPDSSASGNKSVIFDYIYRRSSGEMGHIDNNTVLKSGDCHRIEFTPKCNGCFVYIIKYDTHGQVKMLFPTREGDYELPDAINTSTNPVNSGKTYFVPGKDNNNDHGYFCLDTNTGYETVHFLVSNAHRKNLIQHYKTLLDAYEQNNASAVEVAENDVIDEVRGDRKEIKIFKRNKNTTVKEVRCRSNLGCQDGITFIHE